jgi:COP9 signalosome complex subunit 4
MSAAILAMPDAGARSAAVTAGLKNNSLDCSEAATAFAADAVNVGVGKALLGAMVEWAFDDDCSADDAIAICDAVVRATARRISAFGEEAVRAREVLADVHESADQPQNAVGVLLGMPTEPGLRSAGDEYKVSLYVRIAELSLDLDNTVQAEAYVKKAWALVRDVSDAVLRLRFEACHAKVCDVKRRFLEAAQRFYTLSQRVDDWVDALQKAIVCIVLEDAGPTRSRLIATIYRDERTAACGELGSILSKVYHDRVLRAKDVAALDPFLKPHHKALMRDGRTVFDNAMTQHNLLSASKLYFNISFSELGVLLGVEPERAEEIAAQMAAEDRLPATIDQVNEVINFQSDSAAAVEQWDAQIAAACQSVSLVAEDIARRHPQVAASAQRR